MITENKIYKLQDRQSSYLLLVNKDFIITNNNYSEVILLTHELEFVRTIQLPNKDFICFYAYKERQGNQFLFYEDEGEVLALLDITAGKTTLMQNDILPKITAEPSYLWVDDTFTALTYFRYPDHPGILSINTLTKNITLIPFKDRYKEAPDLATYIDIKKHFNARPIECNQEYMYRSDFYGSTIEEASTMQIINSAGTIVKKFSIKKELEEELTRLYKRSSVAHELPERFPHDVEYQNDWILIIWEGKVVAIDPHNQRTSILMDHLECSFSAKFIRVDDSSAKFVILVQDHGGTKGAELRMYEVSA